MSEARMMKKVQEISTTRLAEETGLAVAVVDSESATVSVSNNNSICEVLYSSEEYAPECARFCGRAFAMATEANGPVAYECHAGLSCVAVPLQTEKPLVAIIGRTFERAENYRKATERAMTGDWRHFPPTKVFSNVLLSGTNKNLDAAVRRVSELVTEEAASKPADNQVERTVEKPDAASEPAVTEAPQVEEISRRLAEFHGEAPEPAGNEPVPARSTEEVEEMAAWRSLFGSLFDRSYSDACRLILKFVNKRYGLTSLAWLERQNDHFETMLAGGSLKSQNFKVSLSATDERLMEASRRETSLDLRERAKKGGDKPGQKVSLFPVAVGGEIRGALVVGEELAGRRLKRHIARFCHMVAPEIEILRLREEVRRRSWIAEAVARFNESIHNIDSDEFWGDLMSIAAELMQAERTSILLFDEESDEFVVKASIGAAGQDLNENHNKIGKRVAQAVLRKGEPVVVPDVSKTGLPMAPPDRKYKTRSFISYPFTIGKRKIGVLNITDKADGTPYSDYDLELLNAIAPQVAVLMDRATLRSKAGQYEQMSVTDALTGLLNRRYLEERLAEEIRRSTRYGYPMSFMMIDVDEFKPYNDSFGHAEGDKALQIVAHCLRDTLRGADVAVRYGGEEFSILLPQTTSAEAAMIAERLRHKVESTEFPNRPVTISIGIASCCLQINKSENLIAAADRALYVAKRTGRNRVQVFESLSKEEQQNGNGHQPE